MIFNIPIRNKYYSAYIVTFTALYIVSIKHTIKILNGVKKDYFLIYIDGV